MAKGAGTSRIDLILDQARALGLRPWIAIKEEIARCVIQHIAGSGTGIVLQGGAALHFAYGSPRLSADVDLVGPDIGRLLKEQGEGAAHAVTSWLGCPARWSLQQPGRLLRGKVTVELGAGRTLAMPVAAYPVRAHTELLIPPLGLVEEPAEIAADKIVASADRLVRRGTLKTTDLYDLWYVAARLGIAPPDCLLVQAKCEDYGQHRTGVDLAAAALAITPEELRAVLEAVLPAALLDEVDPQEVLRVAADILQRYRDVL